MPRNYPGNTFQSPDKDSPICGSELSPGPIKIIKRICSIPATCEAIRLFIAQKELELTQAESDLSSTTYQSHQWYQIRYNISLIKRCLQQAKIKLIWACRPKVNYEEYEARFADDEFIFKTYLYGLMVDNQEYIKARNYLNSISVASEEEIDFVTIQNINLDRLEAENYVASNQTLNTVKFIGEKSIPMSGYARSLYKVLTGIKLELQIPIFEEMELEPRSINSSLKSTFDLSPNPALDALNISFMHDKLLSMSMIDIQGRVVKSLKLSELSGEKNIDISDVKSGIYIIIMRTSSGEMVFKEKVIKL